MSADKEMRTVYKVDIHLTGGTVMYGVTVFDFEVNQHSVRWEGGGSDPLHWIRPESISGVVVRDEYEIEDARPKENF